LTGKPRPRRKAVVILRGICKRAWKLSGEPQTPGGTREAAARGRGGDIEVFAVDGATRFRIGSRRAEGVTT
jgi:hypothetical protein